jgi:hypothetical protein
MEPPVKGNPHYQSVGNVLKIFAVKKKEMGE